MSTLFRRSSVLCLFVICLTTSAFGAARDRRDGGSTFVSARRATVHVLEEIIFPKP